MELTKTLTKTYEIKYVDCKFELEDLSQCRINNVSSTAQTIKNLPFLTYKRSGFEWNPRIILETGQVVCWPKGIRATINFQLKSHICVYLSNTYNEIFADVENIPEYLKLDLVDNGEMLCFTINSDGYIENWPSIEKIVKELL